MTSKLHIYRAARQPATRYRDNIAGKTHWFTSTPRQLWPTDCCHRRRWAKYVEVQVYYDVIYCTCARGQGCKKKER